MVSWGGGATGALSGAAAGSAILPGIGTGIGAAVGGLAGLFGSKTQKPKIYNQSLLRGEQEPLYQQLVNSGLNPGAGGAFGQAADYYRSNLSNNPEDYNAFAAPQLRQFNEEIIPGLSEQFAGMGSGGLSSSGFRNAAINAGTDLSERLGAIRANLRQNSAAGLQNIGQAGLGRFTENLYNEPQPGFLQGIAGGIGQGLGSALPSLFNKNSNPYGGAPKPAASPQARAPLSGSALPNFQGF
jgi:hypothetical protein